MTTTNNVDASNVNNTKSAAGRNFAKQDHPHGPHVHGQTNMTYGWLWMVFYWCCCLIVGWYNQYYNLYNDDYVLPLLPSSSSSSSAVVDGETTTIIPTKSVVVATAVGMITTYVAQNYYIGIRNTKYNRKRNILAILVFGITNGICETFIFLAFYDLGKDLVVSSSTTTSSSSLLCMFVGFCTFSIYSSLIHVLFWERLAFPPKITKPNAPKFYKSALPALIIMSMSWFVMYEIVVDIGSAFGIEWNIIIICLLHIYVDVMCGFSINLPGPSLALKLSSLSSLSVVVSKNNNKNNNEVNKQL